MNTQLVIDAYKSTMKFSKLHKSAMALIALGPLIYWFSLKLNQDLWWDEIISLKDFALEGFTTTTTTYPDPNNHILFNIINGLIVQLFGWNSIYNVFESAYTLRLIQAVFALITLIYTYKIASNFFSKNFAFIAIALLCSTIPFLNFSLQLRGYNLSTMFLVMFVYYTWSFIQEKKYLYLIVASILVFTSLYTLPSNIYFFFGFGLIIGVDWVIGLYSLKSRVDRRKHNKSYLHITIAGVIALLLCYLAYTPVMENLLHNRFVEASPRKNAYVLNTIFPKVIKAFFSYRWLLFLLPLPFIIFRKKLRQQKSSSKKNKALKLLFFFVLPFVFSNIHNKQPFERTFVVLAPFFILFLSYYIIRILELFKHKTMLVSSLRYTILIYLCSTALYQLHANENILEQNLQEGKREQNIYRNYYLAENFQPNKVAQTLSKRNDNTQVLLVDELDRVSFTFYLKKQNIASQAIIKIRDKKQVLNGKKSTHLAMIQNSGDKESTIKYQQFPCTLPPLGKLRNYFFISELNFQKAPYEEHLLLSCFSNNLYRFQESIKNYTSEILEPIGGAHLLKIKKK